MNDDLFAAAAEEQRLLRAPLAARLRPRTIDDVVGQDHQATLDAGFPSSWGGTSPDYGMDPDVIGTFDPITGTPNESTFFAHSTASAPVAVRPPSTYTS